jgi:hypothetical protein
MDKRHPLLGKALALRTEGLTHAQIGKILGATRQSICGMLWRHDNPERARGYKVRNPDGRHGAKPSTIDYKPAKHPYAPDCSCPDFAWDDDHCAAVLAHGGFIALQFRRAA